MIQIHARKGFEVFDGRKGHPKIALYKFMLFFILKGVGKLLHHCGQLLPIGCQKPFRQQDIDIVRIQRDSQPSLQPQRSEQQRGHPKGFVDLCGGGQEFAVFKIKSPDHDLPFAFCIHLVVFRDRRCFHKAAACQFAGSGGGEVFGHAGDDHISHPVLLRLPEQQGAGPGGVMMSAVGFVNPIANVPADIRFLIVADAQVAISDFRPIQQTDMEIIGGKPALFRLSFAGAIQLQTDHIIPQVFHGIKHSLFTGLSCIALASARRNRSF